MKDLWESFRQHHNTLNVWEVVSLWIGITALIGFALVGVATLITSLLRLL